MPAAEVTPETVLAYLERSAPDIAKLVAKDMTAGDVHQTTAIGNGQAKPKAQPFKTLVEQARAAGTLKEEPGDDDKTEKMWSDEARAAAAEARQRADQHDSHAKQAHDRGDHKAEAMHRSLSEGIRSTLRSAVFSGPSDPYHPPDWRKRDDDDQAWSIPLKILKAEPDKQMIFGWASVVEKNGVLVIDKQGDIITPDDLEEAAYDFVLYSRTGGDMHMRKGVSRLIESMIFTKQKQELMGIDLGLVGWWTGWKVDDAKLWDAHKRGERPEFSIGGRGVRVPV